MKRAILAEEGINAAAIEDAAFESGYGPMLLERFSDIVRDAREQLPSASLGLP